jgi:hypothetical protein
MLAFLKNRRRLALVAVLLLAAAATGCGKQPCAITGKVSYRNAPLPGGTIQFLGSDGIPCGAPIGPDGSYTIRVPEGDARVIVLCRNEPRLGPLPPQAAATHPPGRPIPGLGLQGQPAGKVPTIPPRYADWDASGLTATVEPGANVIDFDLTD